MAWRCDFIHCFAGEGVAGNGFCFFGGNPRDPNCPRFEDTEKTIAIYEAEAERNWIAGNITGREFVFGERMTFRED